MKKFKFSAVLASALSLGIVCGSPVFAARKEVKMPSKLSQELVPVLQRQNATVNAEVIAEWKKSSEESKKVDELDAGCKLKRHKACCGMSVYMSEEFKDNMVKKLVKIFAISFDWDEQLDKSFLENKWKEFVEFPGIESKNMNEFIGEFYKNSDEFIEILKSLIKCSKENNLRKEFRIFKSLAEDCNKIKNELSDRNKSF